MWRYIYFVLDGAMREKVLREFREIFIASYCKTIDFLVWSAARYVYEKENCAMRESAQNVILLRYMRSVIQRRYSEFPLKFITRARLVQNQF